ncbi:unnamed protein product [marine sediment metagenome]|uniref:Uncharacterized protein n=1 Tax=marine sediment metagenome TaxID=412755 RepID=X1KJN6_9ZZZZ
MGFEQRGFAFGNRRGFAPPLYVPELKIEEQILHDTFVGLSGGGKEWAGQHFWIPPNRKIAFLAFLISKLGSPTGDVTFIIRVHPTDIVLLSKVWGDASELTTDLPPTVWQEVEFDAPTLISGGVPVEMVVQFSGGDGGNQVALAFQDADVKPDEELVLDVEGHDPTRDAAYRYKYYE